MEDSGLKKIENNDGENNSRLRSRKRGRDNGFAEYGGYIAAKEAKMEKQLSADCGLAQIFQGCAISIDGYTEPSSDKLREIVTSRGAKYVHWFQRSKTTHLLATNLPRSKVTALGPRHLTKVLHPFWVLDCVAANAYLRTVPYQIYNDFGQKRDVRRLVSDVDKTQEHTDDSSISKLPGAVNGSLSLVSVSSETCASKKLDENLSVEIPETCNEQEPKTTPIKLDTNGIESSQQSDNENCWSDLDLNEDDLKCLEDSNNEIGDFKNHHTAITPIKCLENVEKTKNLSNSATKNQIVLENENESPHTTRKATEKDAQSVTNRSPKAIAKAGDPNFLKEFYSNSRLHHIAKWGAEFKELVKKFQTSPCKELYDISAISAQELSNAFASSNHKCKFCWKPSLSQESAPKVIMHIDMDCFFVSVGLLKNPHLVGKPVCVTHSRGKGIQTEGNNSNDPNSKFQSYAEIASCSYEARARGVKNGMFMTRAKALCPELETIPYDFDDYYKTAVTLYNCVRRFTTKIQAVSCDECFVDLTDCVEKSGLKPCEVAGLIANLVYTKTQCHASVGLSCNMLLARIATKSAKPNGIFSIDGANEASVRNHLHGLPVKELPGVGYSTNKIMESMKISTVGDLYEKSISELTACFGMKTAESLYRASRGIDDRQLNHVIKRKSVSAEVNYGIRLQTKKEVTDFLSEITEEVHRRLLECEMLAKAICLKLKIRAQGQPQESIKFMGHGICDNVSKSKNLVMATNNLTLLQKDIVDLYDKLNVVPSDVRGIGVTLNKLMDESGPSPNKGSRSIKDMFREAQHQHSNASKSVRRQLDLQKTGVNSKHMQPLLENKRRRSNLTSEVTNRSKQKTLWEEAAQSSSVYSPHSEVNSNKSQKISPLFEELDILAEEPNFDLGLGPSVHTEQPDIVEIHQVLDSSPLMFEAPHVNTELLRGRYLMGAARHNTESKSLWPFVIKKNEVKLSKEFSWNDHSLNNFQCDDFKKLIPTFRGKRKIQEVSTTLTDLLRNKATEPTISDETDIFNYVDALVTGNHFNHVKEFLKCLRSQVMELKSKCWMNLYNSVYGHARSVYSTQYHLKLSI